jgi:hypothetical protein
VGTALHFGIDYYHYTGSVTNLISNNLIYGNQPANYAIHDVACTPGTLTCPSATSKSDSGTGATFVNFQSDKYNTPASNYNPANYQLKSGSNAINQGTTTCAASPGISPCTPTTDFSGRTRTSPIDIGAYEQ